MTYLIRNLSQSPVKSSHPKPVQSQNQAIRISQSKAVKKSNNRESEEMYNIKYSKPEYESKITELEKKSTESLRRLEAHIRTREIELKEKQDVEMTQIKQSLLGLYRINLRFI